jgi:hypothetical protein
VCDDFGSTFPSWQNRNRIKGPGGAIWLTIPVERAHGAPINEVCIADGPWRRKHLRAIEMSYGAAPYFAEYIGRLREIYNAQWRYLSEFTCSIMSYFRECLGIEGEMRFSSELDLSGRKNSLVIDLCRQTGCEAAYLAAGTRAYVSEEVFREAGIELEYQELKHPVYPQRYGSFVSHLCVLDMLMNCGPKSADIIRKAGEESRRAAREKADVPV